MKSTVARCFVGQGATCVCVGHLWTALYVKRAPVSQETKLEWIWREGGEMFYFFSFFNGARSDQCLSTFKNVNDTISLNEHM